MKKFITLSGILLVFASLSYAKVWQVDSNPGNGAADFTTAQAAHDGASAGDTLYFSGHNISYGDLTVSKQLFIFGAGYFLDENDSTQANKQAAVFGNIFFNDGSGSSMLSGCYIKSCTIRSDNITIKRNYIYYRHTNLSCIMLDININNIKITQNFINSNHDGINFSNNVNNISITNNYISAHNAGYDAIINKTNSANVIVENNVISGKLTLYNSTITNNIWRDGAYEGSSSNSITNNICNTEQFDTTGSNQQNVDMETVFVSEGSTDKQWQILADGPADGKGAFGVDIGMFGGANPYILSGIPSLPAIYEFHSNSSVSQTLPIRVKIKSRH